MLTNRPQVMDYLLKEIYSNPLYVGEKEIFIDFLFLQYPYPRILLHGIEDRVISGIIFWSVRFVCYCVNQQLKTEHDNPTIGLLICKDKDNIEAQYSLEGYNLPQYWAFRTQT